MLFVLFFVPLLFLSYTGESSIIVERTGVHLIPYQIEKGNV